MEPILKNPCFPSILRTWKFFTTYHDYLNLPETFAEVNLYEFHEHITHKKYKTAFTAQLIEALVRKTTGSEKNRKKHISALYLAKENRYNFFQELLKTSAYELGLTQVTVAMIWKDLPIIQTEKAFEELSEQEKYAYLSMLTDLVSTNTSFKKTYMESLRAEYTAATETKTQVLIEIQKKFIPKIFNSSVLGKDSIGNCYFYMSKIGDSILKWDQKNKIWKRIQGHQNIKTEILEKIFQNSDTIENEQVDLLEQVSQIWSRIGWNLKYSAFDRHQKLFEIKEEAPKLNKMNIVKQKLHQLDDQYTKFISDCFNFRWATKQRRIQYHKEIDQAETMDDMVTCFSKFFQQTRHSSQRKTKTLEFYDTRLETKDQKPDQFKVIYLHANYIYVRGVISEAPDIQKYSGNLYHHIKGFLEDSVNFKAFFYEYLMIFLESILGILTDMYPGHYEKRIKQIQKLEEEVQQKKQKKEEEQKENYKLGKKSKLRKFQNNKNQIRENSQSQSEADSEDESQQQTTVEKQGKSRQGLRLREKVKINYKIQTNSNSHKITLKLKKSRPVVKPNRKQPSRNAKSFKNSKMTIDSDSESNEYEDEVNLSVSDEGSESSKKSRGLNLDKYKYEQTSPKVSLRRSGRNSSKSQEKR